MHRAAPRFFFCHAYESCQRNCASYCCCNADLFHWALIDRASANAPAPEALRNQAVAKSLPPPAAAAAVVGCSQLNRACGACAHYPNGAARSRRSPSGRASNPAVPQARGASHPADAASSRARLSGAQGKFSCRRGSTVTCLCCPPRHPSGPRCIRQAWLPRLRPPLCTHPRRSV